MKNFFQLIKCRWSLKMTFSVDDRDDISAGMRINKKKKIQNKKILNKENITQIIIESFSWFFFSCFSNKKEFNLFSTESLIKNKMRYSTTSCHLSTVCERIQGTSVPKLLKLQLIFSFFLYIFLNLVTMGKHKRFNHKTLFLLFFFKLGVRERIK